MLSLWAVGPIAGNAYGPGPSMAWKGLIIGVRESRKRCSSPDISSIAGSSEDSVTHSLTQWSGESWRIPLEVPRIVRFSKMGELVPRACKNGQGEKKYCRSEDGTGRAGSGDQTGMDHEEIRKSLAQE